MKGIRELLFSRAELIEMFFKVEIDYIKEDENSDLCIKEKTLSECLADRLIEATNSKQDRR